MITTAPRPVRIESKGNSWMVLYSDRKKGGRYLAAQFSKDMKTESQVKAWVAENPGMELQGGNRMDAFTEGNLDQWLLNSGEVEPEMKEEAKATIRDYLDSLSNDDYAIWSGAGWSIVLRHASTLMSVK